MLRTRTDLDAGLLVVVAVAFHEAGLQRVDDHRRGFVEAAARFVHAEAEGGEFAPGEAAAHAETEPALGEIVQHRGLFGDPQRIVPGQDDGRRADVDVRADGGHVGHELDVVRHERVIGEMVFGRPEAIEAEIGGGPGQTDLFVPYPAVGAVLPAVAGENHHHADIHGVSPCSCSCVFAVGKWFHGPAGGASVAACRLAGLGLGLGSCHAVLHNPRGFDRNLLLGVLFIRLSWVSSPLINGFAKL